MIGEAIKQLVERTDLSDEDASAAMCDMMDGRASEPEMAAFLVALRMKGETAEEIAALASVMRGKATHVDAGLGPGETLLDTCGTGGDASGTFNISTAAAVVASACGVRVAKHGNRAASSRCGSADVLEALGVRLDLDAPRLGRCLRDVGIAFLFAPGLHPAMKHVAPVRKKLAIRTVFNLLGPLCNPAGANVQVVGVFDAGLTQTMADVLRRLGSSRALVVHGHGGLDEMSLAGPTRVSELSGGAVRTYEVTPEEAGLRGHALSELRGGDATENAAIIVSVLDGAPGPRRDAVLLNSAAALLVSGRVPDLGRGVSMAAQAIDSGAARGKLDALKDFSRGA